MKINTSKWRNEEENENWAGSIAAVKWRHGVKAAAPKSSGGVVRAAIAERKISGLCAIA